MTKAILELDDHELRNGYITVTKIDNKGLRKGKMPLSDVADLLRNIFDQDAASRQVRLVSRFQETPYLAWGQNGAKWVAVKDLAPARYYLLSDTGQAYEVKLPRLIVRVSNYAWPLLFWTQATKVEPSTHIYPLMIGNVYPNGQVCLGTTGLKCKTPEAIDQYIRQIIEAPATYHNLPVKVTLDELFATLAKRWNPNIGKAHRIPLNKLLANDGGGHYG